MYLGVLFIIVCFLVINKINSDCTKRKITKILLGSSFDIILFSYYLLIERQICEVPKWFLIYSSAPDIYSFKIIGVSYFIFSLGIMLLSSFLFIERNKYINHVVTIYFKIFFDITLLNFGVLI